MKRWLEEEWDSNLEDAIVLGKNTEHEPLEHDGVSSILFFLFGGVIICMIIHLSRFYQSNAQRELEEQEARQRQEEIDKFEAPKKLRSKLIQAINRDRLMLVRISFLLYCNN